jgi:hypothetical protein
VRNVAKDYRFTLPRRKSAPAAHAGVRRRLPSIRPTAG